MKAKLIFAAVALAAVVSGAQAQQVSVKGSDTMLQLNQRWAEEFGKSNSSINIAVTGGGSSIGINALINGVTELAASSREMKNSEVAKARSRGVTVNEIPVALDGLAFAVSASNPLDEITVDDLRRIYIGQVTNWKQVGGPDLPIVTFSRDSNSGTYGFVQSNVLRNANWGVAVRFLPSTSEEIRELKRTNGGIAYGGVAYFKKAKNVKILKVAARKGVEAYAPTEDNVRSKRYPVWRHLFYYTDGKPKGSTAKFVEFTLSPAGQKLVDQVGYYSLK